MNYRLIGVIIHIGISNACGHYTSYFVDQNNQWFFADDEKVINRLWKKSNILIIVWMKVSPVSLSRVLAQDPFLLLYELCGICSNVDMHVCILR